MDDRSNSNSRFDSQLFQVVIRFARTRFNLRADMLEEDAVIRELTKGSEIVGTNLWLLICAIFIASIGLDVNSTAVIIGAMLISPLMGPIMGVSLGVSTFRFTLIQAAIRSLAFAVIVSVLTSTTYFLLSPMDTAQSELLARTNPTLWDVFIALIGGVAGMIGVSRKQLGNVVPGVAIATALMPPLCTAGFGLAQGNWAYFAGAFYLFFINSVFICIGGVLVLKVLKFSPGNAPLQGHAALLRKITLGIVFITILPSFLLTYRLLNEAYLARSINSFLQTEIEPLDIEIVNRKLFSGPNKNQIHLSYIGNPLAVNKIEELQQRLGNYGLSHMEIHFKSVLKDQIESSNQILKEGIIEEIFQKNQALLLEREKRIRELESQIALRNVVEDKSQLKDELRALVDSVDDFALAETTSISFISESASPERILLGQITTRKPLKPAEQQKLRNWLSAKFKIENIQLQFLTKPSKERK